MSDDSDVLRRRLLVAASFAVIQAVSAAIVFYAQPLYWRQPYHTSRLTGEAWVKELIHGHPDRIYNELGMRLHTFMAFVAELGVCGAGNPNDRLSLDEQAAIFLYICVTGISMSHAGERFQHSTTTISKYFKKILRILVTPAFYNRYVQLPSIDDPTPDYILNNPKFWPYFKDVIGAMDGTQINCNPPLDERSAARNRKGGVTQNVLACSSFSLLFQYILSGWEGSAADATLFTQARFTGLRIPVGKYYLADAGFGASEFLLLPYRNVRYHLAEWGRAAVRPASKEELYNLRHAQARNVVERIFGVVKKRWRILTQPPEIDMELQVMLPPALGAVHDFIMRLDVGEANAIVARSRELPGAFLDHQPLDESQFGELAEHVPTRAEQAHANAARDSIAQAMWTDYQALLRERGMVDDEFFAT